VNEAKADAEATKTKVNGITLEFSKRVAGSGKIFGNVSATDISAALAKQEINVEKRLIVIPKPIKTLGTFDVNVRFFEGVEAAFQVKVEMDHNQAEELKKAQAKASSKKKAPKEEKTEEVAEATAEENTEA
jgi:large subunit ribosomal protein L9